MAPKLLFISAILALVASINAQSFEAPPGSNEFNPIVPGSPAFEEIIRTNCEISARFFDGTCTNPANPIYGRSNTAVFSYVENLSSEVFNARGRPNPRLISNAISDQEGLIFNDRDINEFFVFFGQFLDHNLVLSLVDSPDDFVNIDVPAGDPDTNVPRFEFRRNARAPAPGERSGTERAQNIISQIVDLSAVYGSDDERAKALRTMSEGRMKVSSGNLLPLNTEELENDPNDDDTFFVAGDPRSNETPMLSVLHTIWLREHNSIIDELLSSSTFSSLSDDGLYELARRINIAQFQKVVFEEFFPAIIGRSLPAYSGFDDSVNPTVSNIFSTAAYRIGHTMVGNGVQILEGSRRRVIPITEMFFQRASFIQGLGGIDSLLRGALTTRAQEVDGKVVDALRNNLFINVPENGPDFDLISINIQRGRDHNVPSYNEIREIFGIPRARSFSDISTDPDTIARFESVYDNVDQVDAWPGLVSEDHVAGSSVGRTMRAVWIAEFTRLRDGDQFYFRRNGLFSPPLRSQVGRIRAALSSRPIFRDIVVRNSGLRRSQVPNNPFFI